MFKSRAEKELERKLKVKRTLSGMNKFISQIEMKKKKLIEQASLAKLKGIDSQYNLAVQGLKIALAQQKRVETMLLNFEITTQLKDISQMTKGFFESMSILSNELSGGTKQKDFVKVQQQFEKAMMKSQMQTERLEAFLESTESLFENLSVDSSSVDDQEIEKLIENQASNIDNDLDLEIEEKLKSLDTKSL
jgi:hypothetical protein